MDRKLEDIAFLPFAPCLSTPVIDMLYTLIASRRNFHNMLWGILLECLSEDQA
jgi:hypothetical protein